MSETTPKLRFHGFSDKWRSLRLDEIATIQRGRFSPRPRNNPIYYGGDIPFVQTSDVVQANGRLRSFSQTLNELGLENSKLFEKGSILITIAANIGYAAVLEIDMACPDSLVGLVPFKTNNSHFICYRLEIEQPRMDYLAVEAAQKNINIEFLKPYKFNIPSLPEQQRIANFLSVVDKKIQALTRKKELLEEYKKGVMQKIFSQEIRFKKEDGSDYGEWEEKSLSKIAKFRRGSFPQPYGLSKWYDDKGMPFVQVYDVDTNFKLKKLTKRRISKIGSELSVFIKKGTLIITIQGSIGRVAITQYDAYIDRTLLLFQEYLVETNIRYFMYVLFLLFEIEKLKAPGGTIKTITKEKLSSFKVMLPEIAEQTKIANFLTLLDDKITDVSSQIDKMKEWKKGLLQQMFV